MSVQQKDFVITGSVILPSGSCLMTLVPADGALLPECHPGQFVQIKVDNASTFLRRPISICDVRNGRELILFIKPVGDGSRHLCAMKPGEKLNIIIPLGHGFTCGDDVNGKKVLLVGGGVGAAPLVNLSRRLAGCGADVTVAIGGRSKSDIEGVTDLYEFASRIAVSTDDGSEGEHGVITQNTVFRQQFDRIYCCGPTPMMKAVARVARQNATWCEVSLENSMACGVGACLCCVQETSDHGNVCVCTEGPVFNINRLESWI